VRSNLAPASGAALGEIAPSAAAIIAGRVLSGAASIGRAIRPRPPDLAIVRPAR
jgi:hypothetical protein